MTNKKKKTTSSSEEELVFVDCPNMPGTPEPTRSTRSTVPQTTTISNGESPAPGTSSSIDASLDEALGAAPQATSPTPAMGVSVATATATATPPPLPLSQPPSSDLVTAVPASGAVSAAPVSTSAPRRAPRAPQSHLPPNLPASANEVSDLASLSRVVTLLSTTIVKAIHDGKSVTASNKRLIVVAAEETRKAMATFERLAAPTTVGSTHAPSDGASQSTMSPPPPPVSEPNKQTTNQTKPNDIHQDLVKCVREEMIKLKGEIITSVTKVIRPTFAQILASKSTPAVPSPPSSSATTLSPSSSVRATAPPAKPTSRPAIVVTPTGDVTTRQGAVAAWRSSISFKTSKYAPSRVKPVSNNKLRIEFETKDQRDEVLGRLRNSDAVTAEPARDLQPMIILKGITREIPSDELCSIVKEQNPTLVDPESGGDLRLRFVRRNRNENLYNAVLAVDPQTWRKMIELGRISVDHQRVHAEDFSPFMQCYACLQFGHGSRHCTQASIKPCAYCAEVSHKETECPIKAAKESPKCFNCNNRNLKFNGNTPVNHTATSRFCPVLLAMKARVDERINYG